MRLVTWNVNSLRARLPRVLELLDEHAPDVLCLQETKLDAAAFPHDELAQAGYRAADHSGGRWAGVAVLAREGLALEDPARGLPGEPAQDECRWVEATVGEGHAGAGVRVVSVYVPNGRMVDSEWYVQKLDFLAAAAERVRELRAAGAPLVLAGDMNVAPADVDVYDPAAFADSTHVTPSERAALQALADAGPLADAFRHVHPGEQQFTWWDYRAGHFHKGLGLRIDLALVSEELAPRLTRAGIERPYRKGARPSDHAPLVVEWTD
ncbi:MAG TPA: exodeoxyribonuclease III [Conexibacter sp.]|jgi:exodeoxyribonuclease-3|nr:exodeoxyribonuclease III [Conexibacter sp.]